MLNSEDKTKQFTFGDNEINIDTLSKDVRDKFEFYDRMRGDYEELHYKLKVWSISLNAMRNDAIMSALKELDIDPSEIPVEENEEKREEEFEEADVREEFDKTEKAKKPVKKTNSKKSNK